MSCSSARAKPAARSAPKAHEIARLAALLLVFLAAPTAGDIGSCGETPADLDPVKFFLAKEAIDCRMCGECGMATLACERACDNAPNQSAFEIACYPLIHDGEVCLNALEAAGCDEYRGFMSDVGATAPTECNFCPPKASSGSAGAGADGESSESPEED